MCIGYQDKACCEPMKWRAVGCTTAGAGTRKEKASLSKEGQCHILAMSCGFSGTRNPSSTLSCFIVQDYLNTQCRPAPKPKHQENRQTCWTVCHQAASTMHL